MHRPSTHQPASAAGAAEVRIITFGVLHGPPPPGDALTVDLRTALRNPHRNPALRHLTGLDAPVREHVLATPGAAAVIDDTVARVLAALAGFHRPRGVCCAVHVYCQGGKHRSVAIAEQVAARLAAGGTAVTVEHRDVGKPVIQP